jgi:hypothetical protein
MPKPYSLDLRERVFRYVNEGQVCHAMINADRVIRPPRAVNSP